MRLALNLHGRSYVENCIEIRILKAYSLSPNSLLRVGSPDTDPVTSHSAHLSQPTLNWAVTQGPKLREWFIQ